MLHIRLERSIFLVDKMLKEKKRLLRIIFFSDKKGIDWSFWKVALILMAITFLVIYIIFSSEINSAVGEAMDKFVETVF